MITEREEEKNEEVDKFIHLEYILESTKSQNWYFSRRQFFSLGGGYTSYIYLSRSLTQSLRLLDI